MILSAGRNALISWSSDSANYTRQSLHFSHLDRDCHIIVIFIKGWTDLVQHLVATHCRLISYMATFLNKGKNRNIRGLSHFLIRHSIVVWAHGFAANVENRSHLSVHGLAASGLPLSLGEACLLFPSHYSLQPSWGTPHPLPLHHGNPTRSPL